MNVAEEYNGHTRGEWAEKLGCSKDTMYSRVRVHGWEKAISMGRACMDRKTAKLHEYNGESHSLEHWAKIKGMTRIAFTAKVRKLGGIKEAMEAPVLMANTVAEIAKRRKCTSINRGPIAGVKEVKGTHHPSRQFNAIKVEQMGISKLVRYQEEYGATRPVLNKSLGYSKVILRGIERGQIKCAETSRPVMLQLCEICTVNNGCGVIA